MSWLGELAARLPQPMRFIIAGGFAAMVNWLARFPLELAMPFVPAVIGATIIGMAVGFISYRSFVFPGSARPLAGQIRDFVAVNLLGMAVTVVVAVLMRYVILAVVDALPGVNAVAHALGIAAGALVNFLGHKRVTFRSA
jgi:energy-coupling factor transport system substrate-specific component